MIACRNSGAILLSIALCLLTGIGIMVGTLAVVLSVHLDHHTHLHQPVIKRTATWQNMCLNHDGARKRQGGCNPA